MSTKSAVVAKISRRVDRGTRLHHDRPRVRVGGSFAGEVSGVELFEGSVDVVRVEHDACRDPVVGVDLEDAERLDVERIGPLVSAREARTRVRARRSPRVAMTVDAICATPRSARARMVATSTSRPCWIPAFTTRRRSSVEVSSANSSVIAAQSRWAKCASCRSPIGSPRFPAVAPAVAARRTSRGRRRGPPRRRFRSG